MYKKIFKKNDGRNLYLYSKKQRCYSDSTNELQPSPEQNPYMIWHPLREEWVIYSVDRNQRPLNPPAEYCPLCPVKKGDFPGEIPFEDYEVAIFENRFPGLKIDADKSLEGFFQSKPAKGSCEVVVYSPEHYGNLGKMPNSRRVLLIEAWIDRYNEIFKNESIKFVMPFENRGEMIGVTLPHPHGQIYSFSYLPPVVEKMANGFEKNPNLIADIINNYPSNIVDENPHCYQYVPPFARFPYETWISTKRKVNSLVELDKDEINSLGEILGATILRYDNLFQQTMQYLMLVYSSPCGFEDSFQFHIQFLPFLRGKDKLKYLASCEQGAGSFLVDLSPEEMADKLKSITI